MYNFPLERTLKKIITTITLQTFLLCSMVHVYFLDNYMYVSFTRLFKSINKKVSCILWNKPKIKLGTLFCEHNSLHRWNLFPKTKKMQHSPPLTHLETIKSHTFVKRFCIPVPVLALVSINKQFVRCALASPSSFVTVRFDVRSDLLPGMEHRAAPCPQEEVCFRHGNIREGRTSWFQGLKKCGKTKKRRSKKMQSFHLFLEKCPISRRKNKHFICTLPAKCFFNKKSVIHLKLLTRSGDVFFCIFS